MRSAGPRSLLWALLVFALFRTTEALGCYVPPAELTTHYTNLIDRTPLIVLAETVGAEEVSGTRVRYDFSVIETLKGRSAPKITLTFRRRDWTTAPRDDDFDRHRDPTFWDQSATRQANDPDCRMNPVFFVGSRYLLFVEAPYHWRSFERITAADDRWLTTVRARVLNGSEFSQPILQWLKDKYALVLYRVDRCAAGHADRTTLTHLETLKGVGRPESDWQPLFAGPAGCRRDQVVLAIHYRGYADPYVTTYPVVDSAIDLTRAETEITLVGPRRISVTDLKAFLR